MKIYAIYLLGISLIKWFNLPVVDIEKEIDILGKEITSLTVADRNAQKAKELYKIQLSIISEKLNSTEVR